MANVTGLGLDQSQIADAINRQNVGLSQKKRNEMMRSGVQSPDSFAMQNQPVIQQAQQPTEFWGSGRKELDPNSDTSLLSALGGTQSNLGGQNYYYSPYDLSKASWGTMQEGDVDLGQGKYDIMRNGQSLGTGYKSLADTLKDYGLENKVTGNTLKDWETLGQILTQGQLTGNYGTPHSVGGNQIKDQIYGLNTLFGSKPIVYDGKLLGYTQESQLDPVIDQWNTQNQWTTGGGWFSKPKQHYSWDVGAAALGREYNNPSWWQTNVKPTSGGNALIMAENAGSNPGWTNSDYFSRNTGQQESGGGFGLGAFVNKLTQMADPLSWELWGKNGPGEFNNDVDTQGAYGAIFDRLDPWLDDLDPGHESTQNALTDLMGNDTQKQTFEQIAPAFVSYFVPFGGLANAANSANQGNYTGALASLVGQAISSYVPSATSAAPVDTAVDSATGAAANSMGSAGSSTGVFGSGASLGSVAADRAVQSLAANTLTGAIANGGNLEQAIKSAAFSTASGGAGEWLEKALTPELGQLAGKALGGAASGGLNSLFSGNSPVNGSLFGAMSGGLHGFLNSTASNKDSFNRETDYKNKQTAQQISKLAQAAFRGKK